MGFMHRAEWELNNFMSFVGAVAAPHSHLQLFTRPAENEDYRAKVARGRKALGVLRERVEKSGADTMLIIHDDHFVNFDFRCYPPFCLLVGKEARGSGVVDPAEIEKITGAVYQKYQGKTSYQSAPTGMPQHVSDWEGGNRPYVYRVDEEFDNHVLDLLAKGEARTLAALPPEEILRRGNGELVNWIIAAGIIDDDAKAIVVEYVRLWHIGL